MRSKRFLSHPIFTLSWWTKLNHDEKILHCHKIPSFASSKSPFYLQLGSRENAAYEANNIEQRELLGFDASRPFFDVIPKPTNLLVEVEGGLSRFSKLTLQRGQWEMSSRTTLLAEKWQRVPWKSPGNRELGVNQEARTSMSELPPLPSRADPCEDPKRNPPLNPDILPFEAEKGHWTYEGCEGPHGIPRQMGLRPSAYVNLQLWGLT